MASAGKLRREGPKKEPRRGECRGSYALHRTHYLPRRNSSRHEEDGEFLWQFYDDSLSVSLITTVICRRILNPFGDIRRLRNLIETCPVHGA
jgi:hypothetical protein